MFKNPHFLHRTSPRSWEHLIALFNAVGSRVRSWLEAMRHPQNHAHKQDLAGRRLNHA